MKKYPSIPLITEPHPEGYTGYPFITLIGYNDEISLNIVDNVVNKQIVAYVLDLCGPSQINELELVSLVADWFYSERHKKHPISVEFSRLGLAGRLSSILRCYPTEYVTRVIGPLPEYKMSGVIKSKKKKKKSIPVGIEFQDKRFK